ncbi:hypothetical protein BDN72DRAFT_344083 [Pluteus cervinus]|uniref:Uncharacterized protein n=1 Tax=Pluteus cervinus TaxID=181527 RepID=A0ACD3B3C4_9AGAR|nr:hypothetical protein BDN72DRAFT_344083 [Pluteus cervinus]
MARRFATTMIKPLISDSRSNERAELDKKIQEMEKNLRDLKEQRNVLSPICRLPSDLLLKIFSLAGSGYNIPELSWLRSVTHICSLWRCVALDAACLWTDIDLRIPELALEKLRRSKAASLSVTRTSPSTPNTLQLLKILGHLDRIRHLDLTAQHDESSAILAKLFAPAPMLETCSLQFDNILVPQEVFESCAMALRSLTLKDCQLSSWNVFRIPNLTSLYLVNINAISQSPGRSQLLLALQKFTHLQTLHIINCHTLGLAPPPYTPAPSFTLKSLTTLHIEDTAQKCANFLNELTPTPSLEVEIHLRHNEDLHMAADYTLLHRFIATFWEVKRTARKVIRNFAIQGSRGYADGASLELSHTHEEETDIDMTVVFRDITQPRAVHHILPILRSLSLKKVTLMSTLLNLPEEFWRYLARYAPSLNTMYYYKADARELVRTLTRFKDGGVCPWTKLEILSIGNEDEPIDLEVRRGALSYIQERHRMSNPLADLLLFSGRPLSIRYQNKIERYVSGTQREEHPGVPLSYEESDDMYDEDDEDEDEGSGEELEDNDEEE